jgi:superoxide dismutase, Fe-Mn family
LCLFVANFLRGVMKNLKQKHEESPKHDYKPKPLPFRTPLNGISDRSLRAHHDKLYAGYVTKKNEIENRLEELGREIVADKTDAGNATYSELRGLKDGETYAVNGVYLHEWYFEILGGDGKFENARELVDALTSSYGSVEGFIKYFSECAMSARGWTILAWDTRESRLWIYNSDAHNQGGVWGALPIIVLDVYEHAYFMDYGADRKAYLKAFWKNFNWSAANDLFKRASSIQL